MKLRAQIVGFVLLAIFSQVRAQGDSTQWAFDAEANLYFFQGGERIFIPTFKADREWLHTEARYNYEDDNTFSAWLGYNFRGGQKLEYVFTPMIGGITGHTKGVALGYETTLTLGKFELYWEVEFLKDASATEDNFFYSWSDLSFSPQDWWWVGISGQRTRLYNTELDFQRGFFVGGGLGVWSLTAYAYNVGFTDEPFVLFTLAAEF